MDFRTINVEPDIDGWPMSRIDRVAIAAGAIRSLRGEGLPLDRLRVLGGWNRGTVEFLNFCIRFLTEA